MKNITEKPKGLPSNCLAHQKPLGGVFNLTDMQFCTGDDTITLQPARGHLWCSSKGGETHLHISVSQLWLKWMQNVQGWYSECKPCQVQDLVSLCRNDTSDTDELHPTTITLHNLTPNYVESTKWWYPIKHLQTLRRINYLMNWDGKILAHESSWYAATSKCNLCSK